MVRAYKGVFARLTRAVKLRWGDTKLSLRTQSGFAVLIGVLRVLAASALLLRSALLDSGNTTQRAALELSVSVSAAYLLVVALVLIQAIRIAREANSSPTPITIVIAVDIVVISMLFALAADPRSDLFLFYLLPLLTAADAMSPKALMMTLLTVLASYMVSLQRAHFQNHTFTLLSSLEVAATGWFPRSLLFVAVTFFYRMQLKLPRIVKAAPASPQELRRRLTSLLTELKQDVPYDTASLQILYWNRLHIVLCLGFEHPMEVRQIEFPARDERYPNKQVIEQRQWVIVDTARYPHFADPVYHAGHIKSWLGVPIISPATGEIIGIISIDSARANAFTAKHAELALRYANLAAALLFEVELGPAALTLVSKRELIRESLKNFAKFYASIKTTRANETHLAKRLVAAAATIFQAEDCSLYMLRAGAKSKVLHLVASTAIPASVFEQHECIVSRAHKTGLTGYAVASRRLLNYGAQDILRSPYHSNAFVEHLKHLPSGRSRQIMIAPLEGPRGRVIGTIKLENKKGWISDAPFPYLEQHLFQVFANTIGTILDWSRQRHFISKQRRQIHNIRTSLRYGLLHPLAELARRPGPDKDRFYEMNHTAQHVAQIMDGVIGDSESTQTLETLGLLPALQQFVEPYGDFSDANRAVVGRIQFDPSPTRDNLPVEVRNAFYYIGCQALLNVIQHADLLAAPAGNAQVHFRRQQDSYSLEICDSGCGFDADKKRALDSNFGLRDMSYTCESIVSGTATLSIDSAPGEGTSVKVIWTPAAADGEVSL